MRGILLHDYYFLNLSEDDYAAHKVEDFDHDEVFCLRKGDIVQVVKVIENETYGSGIAYVIVNEENESITIDSTVVKIIEDK